MALTATANEECKADIVQQLGIEGCQMLTSSFNRSNLFYRVVESGKKNTLPEIVNIIKASHPNETGVIYCLARKSCEEVAMQLRDQYKIKAHHFHAQMTADDKRMVQEAWYKGKIHVIVATVSRVVMDR
jgi:bloom syndrome protein